MAQDDTPHDTGQDPVPGLYRRPEEGTGMGAAEVIGAALALLWLLGAGVFFAVVPAEAQFGALAWAMTVLAVVLPVGMIAVAGAAARATRLMAEDSARLQAALTSLRRAQIAEQQGSPSGQQPSATERKLDEVIAAQRKLEARLAHLRAPAPEPAPRAAMSTAPAAPPSDPQATLALGAPPGGEAAPVSVEDFVRAVHFPLSETDREGFRALKAALRDPATSALVRAAQDVLTLLSEDGIYMDDFAPDRARPEIWRRFAEGARGPAVTALGAIRDRACLARTAGRMRSDAVFRDAAHHFLRRFDTTFARFAETATDAEIAALAETRTARAFMLLGRVAGTFD